MLTQCKCLYHIDDLPVVDGRLAEPDVVPVPAPLADRVHLQLVVLVPGHVGLVAVALVQPAPAQTERVLKWKLFRFSGFLHLMETLHLRHCEGKI